MTAKQDISIPLETGAAYHIYNRGNNKQVIFYNNGNYAYFLDKYIAYMADYWDTYAWALMDNHFHIVIRVKAKEEVMSSAIRDFTKVDKSFYHKHKDLIEEAIKMEQVSNDGYLSDVLRSDNKRLDIGLGSGLASDLPGFRNLVNLAQQYHPRLLKELMIWAVSERFRRFMLGYAKAINKQQERTGSLFQKIFKRKRLLSAQDVKQAICYVHHNPIHHNYTITYDQYQWSSYNQYLSKNADYTKYVDDMFGNLDLMMAAHDSYKEHKKEANYNISHDMDNV
jgi:REP element-mobilizing transposase RayT